MATQTSYMPCIHASKVTCVMPCLWKAAILNNVWERRSSPDPCQPSSCSWSHTLLLLRDSAWPGLPWSPGPYKIPFCVVNSSILILGKGRLNYRRQKPDQASWWKEITSYQDQGPPYKIQGQKCIWVLGGLTICNMYVRNGFDICNQNQITEY